MLPLPTPPKSASRVVRTVHQALAALLLVFPSLVILLNLPAEEAASYSGGLVVAMGLIAKGYNLIFPAEADLPEN